MAVSGEVSDSYSFTASEIGQFEIKVLVTDGKDYSTHKWAVAVSNETSEGFSITGAAAVEQDGFSLWRWLGSLFN